MAEPITNESVLRFTQEFDDLRRENARLREALGRAFCPRPGRDAEDDSVAACVKAGICGCCLGAALSGEG